MAREDVGRHNAVDKVVGWALLNGRRPASGTILMVSGRTSFELAQKAVLAGIPILAGISAVSYTHLDVYKRQKRMCRQRESSNGRGRCGCCLIGDCWRNRYRLARLFRQEWARA